MIQKINDPVVNSIVSNHSNPSKKTLCDCMSSYIYQLPCNSFYQFYSLFKAVKNSAISPWMRKVFCLLQINLNNRLVQLVQPVSKQTFEYHTLDSTFGFNIQILSIPDKETATTTTSRQNRNVQLQVSNCIKCNPQLHLPIITVAHKDS